MPTTTPPSPLDFALSLGRSRLHGGRLQMRFPHGWTIRPMSKVFDVDDAEAAVEWYYERARLYKAGHVVAASGSRWVTLGEVATRYREHRIQLGNKSGDELAANTVAWRDRSLLPWVDGPFARLPVKGLNAVELEAALLARRRVAATSARNERAELLNVLRYAQRLGVDVPPEAFQLAEIKRGPSRPRQALNPAELDLLIDAAPDYARRHLRFLSTAGLRVGESFHAVDEWLDGDVLRIPDWATKERRSKTVVLDNVEQQILAEQILARPVGARNLFPKKEGGQWKRYGHFHRLVWRRSCARAAALALVGEHVGVDADKLATLTPHDLRSTAITRMVQQGIPDEVIAARVGHDDGGILARAHYTVTAEADQRAALAAAGTWASDAPAGGQAVRPPARRPVATTRPVVVSLTSRKATP